MSHLEQRINHCSEKAHQLTSLRTLVNPDSFYLIFSGKIFCYYRMAFQEAAFLKSEQNASSAKVRMIYNTYTHITKAPSSQS